MDPRRKERIDKIFLNLKKEQKGFDIYDCEVDQSDGSLVFKKEEHVKSHNEVHKLLSQEIPTSPNSPTKTNKNILSLPPALPSLSIQKSLSSHASQITFQADIHAPFEDTHLKPTVESISTELKSSKYVKTISFVRPKHIILHSNKSMTISNECLDLMEVSTPTPTEHPSENDSGSEKTSVFTDTTQNNLLNKEIDVHSLSLITAMPFSASPTEIENINFPGLTEDELDINTRSSPSILLTSSICMDENNFDGGLIINNNLESLPTYKRNRTIENLDKINLDETNVIEQEKSDNIPKRKRSKKSDKNTWKRSADQKLRERGMPYKGKKKEANVWVYNKIREGKSLKPRCNCKLSNQDSKFKCSSITEEKRNKIFKKIWSIMSWKEKRMYIKTLTIVKPIKRKRTNNLNSYRKQTFELYLEVDSVKKRDCKTMFLNTLAIGEWSLHNWTALDIENETRIDETERKTMTRQQLGEFKKEEKVKQFFNSLPKLESHYCRSQSSKLYLEPIRIVQKILEKGHTQMEADSMHSVIERQVRNKKINVPADYVYIAKTACHKKPYHVEYLDHTFFKRFDNLNTYKTIRPGKKAGDPVVTDLRQLTYLPEGRILYRLGFTEEHDENPLPMRVKLTDPVSMKDLPRLYSERLKIKKSKFEHLQQLKMVMEPDYHPFYDAIPYE